MKEQILQLVAEIKEKYQEKGVSLKDNPALFEWRYEEVPELFFQLMIQELEEEVPEGETIQ